MKKILSILILICSYSYAGELEFYLFSREPNPDKKGKYNSTLRSISIDEMLKKTGSVVEGEAKLLWSDPVYPKSLIREPLCKYFSGKNLLYYMYVKDTEEDEKRRIKIFDLKDPAHPRDVPRDYYKKTLGCFYLPQFDLDRYPNQLFVLFMNHDVDVLKLWEALERGEITYAEHRKIRKKVHLLSPTLKSYSIDTFKEKIEPDLNLMATMGEELTVFLSPNGEINYGGYGLRNDKIKIDYRLPDKLHPDLKITANPSDNAWVIIRNRPKYFILRSIQQSASGTSKNQTLVYFKKQNLWKLYETRFSYDVVESKGFLILHFEESDPIGVDYYLRRKLCINLETGDRFSLYTELDSQIIYYAKGIMIIKNETGFEVFKNEKSVKFIHLPGAKYIEKVMLKKCQE